jgi:hypothetical protein
VFASGAFAGSHIRVGPDGCLYISQGQTRYDNGVVDDTHHHSLVQICDGFMSATPTRTATTTPTRTSTPTATPTPTSTPTLEETVVSDTIKFEGEVVLAAAIPQAGSSGYTFVALPNRRVGKCKLASDTEDKTQGG